MTLSKRDQERLQYIAQSLDLIDQYVAFGKAAFDKDTMVQDAILRRLETLADATHHLPDELKDRHPNVPWRAIYGFRNVAAHAYEVLDLRRVWQIVTQQLSDLKAVIHDELAQLENEST